ncbi:sugar phosphate isomerase/epimerase family protein [Paenibacillus sp. GCM10023252]|uniref:sugar phosphate isomerase/epimerase family protein n=1 Tax=Paenibacillus sp. GCM10023252 TaxID=3252649 RepID=UPI003611AE19
MNRLAFSTLPCEGWTLEEMIAIAKSSGYSGIELRVGEAWAISTEMTALKQSEAYQMLHEAGVTVTNLGSSVCFTGSDADEQQLELFKKTVRLAAVLRTKAIRVFLGYFNQRRDIIMPEVPFHVVSARIKQACQYASAYGIQVWIETHNEYATARSLRQLLDDVEMENCAVIYDIIHPLEEGERPEDTLALLGSDCAHVHIKDGTPSADPLQIDWTYTRLGEGRVPIASIVHQLEQSGYSGFYSLEWETKWRVELQRPDMGPERVLPEYVAYMNQVIQSRTK